MGRLNNSEFLKQLGEELTKNNGESSINLTQKRLSIPLDLEEDSAKPTNEKINDLPSNVIKHSDEFPKNTQKYPILIRLALKGETKKQKTKLSTVVEVENVEQFWVDYSQVVKKGFVGLKKKEKKKSKKTKISK